MDLYDTPKTKKQDFGIFRETGLLPWIRIARENGRAKL